MALPMTKVQQSQKVPVTKNELSISSHTKEKADSAKAYIERKYTKLKNEEKERRDAWEQLQKKMEKLSLTSEEQEQIKKEIMHREAEFHRMKRKKITVKDFEPIAIIGRGAFGEVRVCRMKTSGEVVAMKKMKKSEMIYKNQVAHVRAERDVLASAKSQWIVDLKYSFQDEKYLYLVMEYLAGGDLMTLLMRKDILTEDEGRFYIAEMILAVDNVHKLNYIHRDLKPDNVLLDRRGHVKLSDFGLCKHAEIRASKSEDHFIKKVEEEQNVHTNYKNSVEKRLGYKRNRQLAFSTVGTPDYIAPEVFGQGGYNESVDWWSVGVILFEMLVGYPPFFSDDPSITCQKILHWKKTLVIPPEANLSPAATDLLKRMICDSESRLGINGIEEIKRHPFFEGVDWEHIREDKAPYSPEVKSEIDTSNFDHFEEEEPFYPPEDSKASKYKKNRKLDIPFIGYTSNKEFDNLKPAMVAALQEFDHIKFSIMKEEKPMHKPTILNESAMSEILNATSRENMSASYMEDTHYSNGMNGTQAKNLQPDGTQQMKSGSGKEVHIYASHVPQKLYTSEKIAQPQGHADNHKAGGKERQAQQPLQSTGSKVGAPEAGNKWTI